ncbi:hypothetical protein cypCar_00010202 [Cyprinus carpio]|nr:hypothetical protein cypCar_00010202 [Cyprinus carpio]
MPFAPVPWDFNRPPPKRGKSVEELVSEGWEKERCMQMLHFQQQQQLQQQSVMCPQDFRPAPGHWEHQAYLGEANGYRQQCWEYEDWDKVPYQEVPPQQFFYQSPEAVYQEPRKPQEWTGNHCFYQHQEEPDYSDHRDFAQSPRSKERPDYVTRYHSWESDEYCEEREPYSRRDRYAYGFDRDNQDYYDKALDNYRDGDRRGRDYYDHKELDKYDRYDRRDKHYDSKHQEHYNSRKKDWYRYRKADHYDSRDNSQYERYDRREKDQSDDRNRDRYDRSYCEEGCRRGDSYQYRDRNSIDRRDYDQYVERKGDYYDYKEKEKIRSDFRKDDYCGRRERTGERDSSKLDDKEWYEHKKGNHYDLKPRDRYDYRENSQSEQRDRFEPKERDSYQYREGDQCDYREKDDRNYWKDERYDSGIKDCYEDKGCESDQYDQKSRERYRDVRSNSLDPRQHSDHNSGRHCKEWEKDVYQKQTLKQRLSYEDTVKLSYDIKDQYCDRPGSGKMDMEGQGRTRKPAYVGSLDRNSFYRKTAPSSLRRSEFATNRKKKQVCTLGHERDLISFCESRVLWERSGFVNLIFKHTTKISQNNEMTLLVSQPKSLESSPASAATTEDPEQRMLEKRSKVIEELLQTEHDYIKDLQMCVQNIDFDGLFGNISSVIDLSRRLYKTLQDTDSIGQVFLDYKGELEEVYKIYCQNHDDAISLLETYEKDENIQKHVLECLEKLRGKTNYINLGSFLIKPVQRVMRYPLLLMELLNTTPESHHDRKQLAEAVMSIKEINVNINEYKRRKDLVVKYRKGDEDRLIDKISKLSMHSIIKKSNRVSSHLKHLTGISPQIKDEAFDEAEKRFRLQERLIKSFIRDISLYLQHIRKERTEALVITPLTQLLNMFAGPHKLIQKRRDKLLDYDNCKERAERLKDKRVQEELQRARNNYEALNAQLLDELPKFHRAAEELFTSCVRGFTQAQRDFIALTLGELTPLLQLSGLGGTEGNLVSLFQEEHTRVLDLLQSVSFFPDNLPTTTVRKPFDKKTLEKQNSKKQQGPPNYVLQTDEHRAGLLARYGPEKLYQAERNFNAAQDLDVSVLEGDIVGVIKQQDPMGSQNRWLIDSGVTKGFVYSSFLKPYNPRRSHSDVSIESQSSNESGYGGSSPMFSRQNSNSTLTFNQETSTVSFTTAMPPHTRTNQETTPRKNREASSTNSQRDSLDPTSRSSPNNKELPETACRNNNREHSEPSYRNSTNHRDSLDPEKNTPTNHRDPSDFSETDTCPSRYEPSSRYHDSIHSIQKRRPQNSPEEDIDPEPEPEIDGHQLHGVNELSISANQRVRILEFQDMNGNQEWWLGEAGGRRGYVPSNYIRKSEYT